MLSWSLSTGLGKPYVQVMGWLSAFSHSQGSEGSESSAHSGVHVAGVSPVEPRGVGCCPRHDSSALRSAGGCASAFLLDCTET